MRIDVKYNIGQPVKILAINAPATVTGYKIDGRNKYVIVMYWLDGKLNDVYLPESEIEPIKERQYVKG